MFVRHFESKFGSVLMLTRPHFQAVPGSPERPRLAEKRVDEPSKIEEAK